MGNLLSCLDDHDPPSERIQQENAPPSRIRQPTELKFRNESDTPSLGILQPRQLEITSQDESDAASEEKVLCSNPRLVVASKIVTSNEKGSVHGGRLTNRKVTINKVIQSKAQLVEFETALLRQLDHENILQFYFVYDDPFFIYFVTEFHEISLSDYFRPSTRQKMAIKTVLQQITNAVDYLQDLNINHLGINPKNIFIVGEERREKVKLTNFNHAVGFDTSGKTRTNGIPGIEGFVSPEVFANATAQLSSDIYSLGCVYFFLLSKGMKIQQIKFKSQENIVISRIRSLKAKSSDEFLCVDLMQKMLCYQPNWRPSTKDITSHPYFFTHQQTVNFIIETVKIIESKNEDFKKILYQRSKSVTHEDWTAKIEDEILQDLNTKRQAFRAKNSIDNDDPSFNGGSIVHLIQTIRNISVHSQTPIIKRVMGSTHEEFLNYWLARFPNLIVHLHVTKTKFENVILNKP